MKRFLIFLLVLFILPISSATITLNQSTTLATVQYENETVENVIVNVTDTIVNVKIDTIIRQFPQTIVYALQDKNNNMLKVSFVYDKVPGIFLHKITKNISAEYNNIPVNFTYGDDINVLEIPQHGTYVGIFNTNYYMSQGYSISGSLLQISGSLLDMDEGVGEILDFYPNKLIVPSQSSGYENTYFRIQYTKLIKATLQTTMDNAYAQLNPVFKFVFLVFKTSLKIVDTLSLGYAFSDADLINYQMYLLAPLQMLDMMVDMVFDLIAFILAVGIIAIFIIIECIIFIFSYATNRGSMLTIISISIQKSISVWTTILVKPIVWMYENFLLRILGK